MEFRIHFHSTNLTVHGGEFVKISLDLYVTVQSDTAVHLLNGILMQTTGTKVLLNQSRRGDASWHECSTVPYRAGILS